jgi:protein-S-isoprenylcysteine O-methyltransferase Ste14
MLLRHLASIIALPVTVIIVVPILLASLFPFVLVWNVQDTASIFLLFAGTVLAGLGFILLYSTISLFIKKGDGTIAPWDPTRKLIITGVYAHVRNPMHISVFLMLTGESILVDSFPLILWTLLFIAGNLIYIPVVEERKLVERFEDEYLIYKRNVPGWIPRLSSWKPTPQPLKQSKKHIKSPMK